MDDPWESLRLAALEAMNPLWDDFAKEGRESAVLAPLAKYPSAAAWLARSMGMSTDCITRKLAAMLAGWIQDPRQISILSEMLDGERKVFLEDSLSANSVAEDVMFAATRWTESQNLQVKDAGIKVLTSMITDALEGTPWNTVHWAVANLYRATNGNHEVLDRLAGVKEEQTGGQKFFWNAIKALQQNDQATLTRFVTAPSEPETLLSTDPHYSTVTSLWKAAASAEAAE